MLIKSELAYVYLVFFINSINKAAPETQGDDKAAKEFSEYTIVQPSLYHGRTKRAIHTTKITGGEHPQRVAVEFEVDGEPVSLDLVLNRDLLTQNHVLSYQKNGKTILHTPSSKDLNICQYQGDVRSKPGSWAAISTCQGLRGLFYDGHKLRYIEPKGPTARSLHYIYDHSNLVYGNSTKSLRSGYKSSRHSRNKNYKGTRYEDPLREPYNGNPYSSYIELVVVVDHRLYRKRFGNLELIYTEVKNMVNVINSIMYRADLMPTTLSTSQPWWYREKLALIDRDDLVLQGRFTNINNTNTQIRTTNICRSYICLMTYDVAANYQATALTAHMYAPLNVFVSLVGLKVWTYRDEMYISESAVQTLDAFLKYRFEKLLHEIPNDHAVLLTDQKFLNDTVGNAYVKHMCTREHSGSVATNSEVLGFTAATIAHEIGHNLAMDHDSNDCECKDETCVMAPVMMISLVPSIWSDCSLTSLAISLQKGGNYCLRNKPDRLFESPTCGNGFVERGEQCDCGRGKGGNRECESCCHRETCLLRSNATCATGKCCNLQTCQIKSVAELCRAPLGECDLPEYCSGESEFCPEDVHKMDTTPCARNEAYCVRGKCRTHYSQCRLLWGQSASNGQELCYIKNYKEVSVRGNCGFDYFKAHYLPCKKEDALCGRLQCIQYSGEVEFGSVINSSINLINLGDRTCTCSVLVIDTGTEEDPGMVPDGATCGKDKICMNQQCLDVGYVRERMKIEKSVCPSDCSGHGVCNSEGNCHCDEGFAPPLCESPGPGGSIDSGPQSDPHVLKSFMIAMYVIFLGILPLIILLLLLIFCLKRRKQNANLEDLTNGIKLQNSTAADFKLFSFIRKSTEKRSEREDIHNTSKPKLRKEDITVISDCDKTKDSNPTYVNTNSIRKDKINNQKQYGFDRVNTTSEDYANVNFNKQIKPTNSDNSKPKPPRNHAIVAPSQKKYVNTNVEEEALMSKHIEEKNSHKNNNKTPVVSSDILEDCAVESNVGKIRKMFDTTK